MQLFDYYLHCYCFLHHAHFGYCLPIVVVVFRNSICFAVGRRERDNAAVDADAHVAVTVAVDVDVVVWQRCDNSILYGKLENSQIISHSS